MKRVFRVAGAVILLGILGAAPADPKKSAAPARLQLELSFLEFFSRETVSQQELDLALDAKSSVHPLKGKELAGWTARVLAREVTVNAKAKGFWVEMTFLGPDGKETGYLATILPQDPAAAFSAATRIQSGRSLFTAAVTRAD